MTIVQIVTQMEGGGAQRVAALLASAFGRRGLDQELWFLYRKRPTYDDLPNNLVIWDYPPRGPLDYARIIYRLCRQLRRNRPSCLITHTHYSNVLGCLIGMLAGVKCRIAVQHNPVGTYPRMAKWLDWILGASGVYHRNIAVSQAVIASVQGYPSAYRQRVNLVRNGIEVPTAMAPEEATRRKWRLPVDRPLLVSVGRLSTQKNHEAILKAMRELPDAHLALVGEGELRAALVDAAGKYGVGDRTRFLGEVSPFDVWDILAAADVFVFPSVYEAMPLALMEAMGAGVPIVASRIPANCELLAPPGLAAAGVLVDVSREGSLAGAIRGLLESPADRNALSLRAREEAARFSVETMADRYLGLAGEVAREAGEP